MEEGLFHEERGPAQAIADMMPKRQSTSSYRVAVTGHRDLYDQATVQFVYRSFYSILNQLQHTYAEELVALSGLAAGADLIFAEVALALSISLEAIIAYNGLIGDFPLGPTREQFLRLRSYCRSIHTLPFSQRSNTAYMALGCKLVDSCDLLLAAWNGLPARAEGGTGDVVAYALQQGRPVVHIHTVHLTINSNVTTKTTH